MKKALSVVGGLFLIYSSLGTPCCAGVSEPTCCYERGYFEIGADWLYWKAVQDDLVYAAEVAISDDPGSIISETISPDFRTKNGYRIFADYSFCEGWNLAAIFSHLTSKDTQSFFLDEGTIATHFFALNSPSFPLFTAFPGIAFSQMSSEWQLKFNYFDLDCSHNFCLNNFFQVNPHIGLRGLWIDQRLNIAAFSPADDGTFIQAIFKDDVSGYGVEGGIGASWNIGCGFSLVGDFGGSLLYTRIKTTETASEIIDDTSLTIEVRDDPVHHACPTIDSFLGLQYTTCCCNCGIEIHAGWEQHIIFNVNHFEIVKFSDLSLQGLTLGGSIGF